MQYPATRTAAISTTALTLASALTVTAASALEHQDRHTAPKRLNASAHSGSFDVLTRQTTGLKARFTERDGTPVAGLPVKFTVSGEKTLLCEAATDTSGYAECKPPALPPLPASAVKLLTAGYDATTHDTPHYAPTTTHNTIGLIAP
ncbi:hypothetical protein [Streptomyces sp. NRRL B-11253]|uniref:hypothetical protein n=1 Tax=Streptomyces sp. NRRL B-11253 TaxID=1463826 RepID=UPI00067BF7ED|nr:hypothetical protein [Streptomyces sp. NRRL B-11253]